MKKKKLAKRQLIHVWLASESYIYPFCWLLLHLSTCFLQLENWHYLHIMMIY